MRKRETYIHAFELYKILINFIDTQCLINTYTTDEYVIWRVAFYWISAWDHFMSTLLLWVGFGQVKIMVCWVDYMIRKLGQLVLDG